MAGLALALQGLQGLSSLGGLLSNKNAIRELQRQRDMAFSQLQSDLLQGEMDQRNAGLRTLYTMTGDAGDALRAYGSNLGAALANSGMYNASAVGGALVRGKADTDAQLGDVASRNYAMDRQLHSDNARYLGGLKLNDLGERLSQAQSAYGQSQAGLGQFLGNLTQYNLRNLNAPNARELVSGAGGNQGHGITPAKPLQGLTFGQGGMKLGLGTGFKNTLQNWKPTVIPSLRKG